MHRLAKIKAIYRHRRFLKEVINSHIYFINARQHTFWGSVSREAEQAIVDLTARAAALPGPIIEIGGLFGFTTQLIATHKPIEKELLCVENFSWNPFFLSPEDHRTMTHRILYFCVTHCNTKIIDADKRIFYENYIGSRPSMIFIDACHAYDSVMEDLRWAKFIKAPMICGHDYCETHPGVVQAVDEMFERRELLGGSVWYANPV